jgi:serine/threonine-protein kinase
MSCFDDAVLLDLIEGRRTLQGQLATHLATCNDCRMLLASAARGAGGTPRDAPLEDASEPSWDELGAGVIVAGRYELTRFLGAGGMGIVWAARVLPGEDEVALKVARTVTPELARRFEREAQITSALKHPNIVRILDVVPATDARGPCLVQELLHGESLEVRLAPDRALSLGQAARVVLAVVDALEAAHAQGVVHRDLKPQNVFLSGTRVVVIDFGIAKLLSAWGPHARLTRTGAVLGTPHFMAPEQIAAEPTIDARADVWALGALTFRMLAGRSAIGGRTFGEVHKALQLGQVAELERVMPSLPPPVLAVVRQALVLDRARRLTRVRAFRFAFGPYAASP